MKILQVKEETLVVGVDIGSEEHYARAFDWRGIELGKVFRFENTEKGFLNFKNWLIELKSQNAKTVTLIGAEPTGHYWFGLGAYLKDSGEKLVLVNPYHVMRTKELDDNHPSKTDMKDPKTIAKLVIDGRYTEPNIVQGVFADIRVANNNRLRLQKDMNALKNRVERWLKIYFPEYKNVFGDWTGKGSLMVLKEIPLPEDVRSYGVDGINQIWRKEKVRALGKKRALKLYNSAKKSIGLKEGLQGAREEILMLVEEYELKMKQYEKCLRLIEKLLEEVPNADLMLEMKGIGTVTAAGFIAEVGDISRYDSPKQIQKLAGLALKENSSGKHRGKTSISKRGRKRLRTLLFQVVMPLIGKVEEFKDLHSYYTTRQKNPLKKKQSIVALSCKLIRVFYAILTKGIKYDAKKLVGDIRRPELKAA
jgi:transposase